MRRHHPGCRKGSDTAAPPPTPPLEEAIKAGGAVAPLLGVELAGRVLDCPAHGEPAYLTVSVPPTPWQTCALGNMLRVRERR